MQNTMQDNQTPQGDAQPLPEPSPVASCQLPVATVLYVTDWPLHYEVNRDGRRWEPGQTKRLNPLQFVRSYVYGPAGDNMAYVEVAETAAEKYGPDTWSNAWGLFCKLLEVAARQKSEFRGYILGRRGSPMSARMMQTVTRFPKLQIEQGLQILTDPEIAWLQWVDMPALASVGELGETGQRRHSFQEPKRIETNNETNNETERESQDEPKGPSATEPVTVSQGPDGSVDISADSSDMYSVSGSDSDRPSIDQSKLTQLLRKYLSPEHGATQAQHNGNYTCIVKIVQAVEKAALGDPQKAATTCADKAATLVGQNGNAMAIFIAWFNKQLPGEMTIRDLPNPKRRVSPRKNT